MKYEALTAFYQEQVKLRFIDNHLEEIIKEARIQTDFHGRLGYKISGSSIIIAQISIRTNRRVDLNSVLFNLQKKVDEILNNNFSKYILGCEFKENGKLLIK